VSLFKCIPLKIKFNKGIDSFLWDFINTFIKFLFIIKPLFIKYIKNFGLKYFVGFLINELYLCLL